MKQLLKIGLSTLFALATLAVGPSVWADKKDGTFFGHEAPGQWMIGVKGGALKNSANDFDDATEMGFLLGYEFARPVGVGGSTAIEFEGTTTTSDGTIGPDSDFGAAGKWEGDTLALYFAYRTKGTVYFKGKVGGMYSDLNNKFVGQNIAQDDFSFGFGGGLGVHLGKNAKIEVEYTGNTGDNDLQHLTLGGILQF